MMRSLYSGISGLAVHQTKMDVIGNNIANVNTTAYKSSRVTFTDVFSQKLAGAASGNEDVGGTNPKQIGLGATVGSIDLLMGEGAAQRTDNELDLKIEGDGFFIVNDGKGNKFTRDGSFKIDANGYLVNSSGYYVCGWTADKDGNISKTPVDKLSMVTNETYSVPASKTSKINFGKNLNVEDGSTDSTGVTQLSTIFDSLGNEYTVKQQFYYLKTPEDVMKYNENHEGDMLVHYTEANNSLTAPSSGVTSPKYEIDLKEANFPVWVSLGIESVTDTEGNEVNASAEFVNYASGVSSGTLSGTEQLTLAEALNVTSGYPQVFRFKSDGTLDKEFGAGKSGIKLDFGNKAESPIEGIISTVGSETAESPDQNAIAISLNDLTQYNSSTTATSTYDGNKPGTMSSYSIGSDGIISAKYSNGETKILGQISLATFNNSAGLEKVGGNLYQTTLNSGEFDGIGVDPTSVGSLNAGTLEMSNVDLSTEFTEMITTQRGFQANSRIITTSDTLLEELVNLKR
ncbi:MAG: flagellar hook protein FlgE [Clostridia bacterium]|nr:flagellar hook protein FlgE [Clostridia bacterium]